MKVGLVYRSGPNLALDAVLHQSKRADEQGFDSLWLPDHLASVDSNEANPHEPPESMTLMGAIAAVTKRVELAWSMLNPGFRSPAVLAKMISTLDQIAGGRIICSLGSGFLKAEYDAYGLPFIEDPTQRVAYLREVVVLLKQLWQNVAPAAVTFRGTRVRVEALQFAPQPYRKPHPPIWIGGDSPATLAVVREFADGWVSGKRAGPEYPRSIWSAPDWPSRPMTIAIVTSLIVAETRDAALGEARVFYDQFQNTRRGALSGTFEEFINREIVGSPQDCLRRIGQLAAFGINHLVIFFENAKQQDNIANLLLPHIRERADGWKGS